MLQAGYCRAGTGSPMFNLGGLMTNECGTMWASPQLVTAMILRPDPIVAGRVSNTQASGHFINSMPPGRP